MRELIAVIDAGTTGVRAALVDDQGCVITQHAVSLTVQHPEVGSAEQSIEDMWGAAAEALSTVCAARPADAVILAVNISSQRASVALLDGNGDPLTPFLLWMDLRGAQRLDELAAVGTERFIRISGTPFGAMPGVTRVLWARHTNPDLFARARRIVNVADALTAKLTGHRTALDYTSAAWTGLFDMDQYEWSSELLNELNLDPALLPPLVSASEAVGVVSRDAAAQTGLPSGIPVFPGAGDQQCSSAGAGAVELGAGSLNLGTSATYVAPALRHSRTGEGFIRGAHVLADLEDREGTIPACGSGLRWLASTFGYGDNAAGYATVASEAATVAPGSAGLRFGAFFAGSGTPTWKTRVASMVGLELRHDRQHIARSMIESIGLQFRHITHALDAVGQRPEVVTAIGGAARSADICQILADTSRQVLKVPKGDPQHTAMRGAASVAWLALGHKLGGNVDDFIIFEPSSATANVADDLFAHYLHDLQTS